MRMRCHVLGPKKATAAKMRKMLGKQSMTSTVRIKQISNHPPDRYPANPPITDPKRTDNPEAIAPTPSEILAP
jgi:hypothetical protein